MIAGRWNYRLIRLLALASVLATAGWLGPRSAAAADLDKLDASLKLIPADAAFYGSALRNREKVEAIMHSKAWAKIMEMPAVKEGLAAYKAQLETPGSNIAKFDAKLKTPEVQKILQLLADMGSDEVFLYGDANFLDLVQLFQTVNTAQMYGAMSAGLAGQTEDRNTEQIQTGAVISALAHNLKLIGVPNLVVGFKLKNTDLAKEELVKLEVYADLVSEQIEPIKGHFKKTKVGSHEYLVLDLDGGMIPWDQISLENLKEAEAAEGDVQKIVDQVKKSKLVIAVGVRDNYLLVSIGRSLDCLEKLGQGQRLIDRAEFKPLGKFTDKRLLGIGYLSEALNRQANGQKKNINTLLEMSDKWLKSSNLSDEQKKRIGKDVQDLAKDVKSTIPEPGAVTVVKFLADQGVESYMYSWGSHGDLDGSQPLGLLRHVGGYPLFGAVTRHKPLNVADYDKAVKWAGKACGYFKEFALPAMPQKDRKQAEKFIAAALPLVARLDKANRELFIPALADGQVALVIDDKLASKHFIESLPATEKPMPMIEPAIVLGIRDAKLFKKGLGEYRAVINGSIDVVRQSEGANVPESFQIPKPKVVEDGSRAIYSLTLPDELGLDKKIEPNVGISEKVAVFSLSSGHTERLLKDTPPGIGGVLGTGERPLAGAVWLQWAELVQAATPWADFAAERIMVSKDVDEDQRKPIADQVHTVLDVLKALRSISSESYLEDGALVTHVLAEIHDVEK